MEFLVLSSFLGPVGFVALVVLVVAAVSARGEPDPTGRRPYAAYLFVVSFLAIFTLVFAGFAAVSSLVHLATHDDSESAQVDSYTSSDEDSDSGVALRDPETGRVIGGRSSRYPTPSSVLARADERSDNADIRAAVLAGIVMVVAGLLLAFHGGRARRLVAEAGFLDSSSRRLYQTFLYAVCFVAMITALGALAAAGYGGFRALAPGIASSGGDDEAKKGLAQLISAGVLSLAALLVFLYHWRRAESVLARRRDPLPPPEPPGTAPPPPAPAPA